MEQQHLCTYFFTAAVLERVGSEEMDAAIRECKWTGGGTPCTAKDPYLDDFSPADFNETRFVSHSNRSFWVLTRHDLGQQWILTPDEHDFLESAFGPSPMSEKYFSYQISGENYPTEPADLNMVEVDARVVHAVGWESLTRSVLRYIDGNLGDQRDVTAALTLGGQYRIGSHWLCIARGDSHRLKASLLDVLF